MSNEEWSKRLRLLLQDENEAAHEVAARALELVKLQLSYTPGSHAALARYSSARVARERFIAEVSFP
jgi:hypothetical protein